MGNNRDLHPKFYSNTRKFLDNRIMKVGYSSLNNVEECVNNKIISKDCNFFNSID